METNTNWKVMKEPMCYKDKQNRDEGLIGYSQNNGMKLSQVQHLGWIFRKRFPHDENYYLCKRIPGKRWNLIAGPVLESGWMKSW